MNTLKTLLLKFIENNKVIIILNLIYTLGSFSLEAIIAPYIFSQILNKLTRSDYTNIYPLFNKVMLIYSIKLIFGYLLKKSENIIYPNFVDYIRTKIFSNYIKKHSENFKDLKIGDRLDGEGGFCARGKLITSKKSKDEKILPLGLTDGAIVKKDINKDQSIRLDDVELDLPEDVVKARQYQYDLI